MKKNYVGDAGRIEPVKATKSISVRSKLIQSLENIDRLERERSMMMSSLFGESNDIKECNETKEPPDIETLVSLISEKLVYLCNSLQTINNRLVD